ncbi:hypothetical protein [Bacillus cereus]|uniref:Tetratricopeptide repeat protein n=1 Tax=Bacillus cereus TaxID=1396 RepID=A0AA44TD05_BACCE|nr:hypothetical protein [Bacillus cereus]PFM99759.1 hypothetical protein COJ55_25740 [Bacillus cereus]PFR92617.1 hypothetical protein COK38_22325 [Bacillus cereus]
MKLKLVLLGGLGAIMAALLVFYYLYWIKPYHLPEVKQGVSLEEQGLTFEKEEEVIKKLKSSNSTNEQGTTPYKDIIVQLEGNKSDQEKGVENLKKLIKDEPDNLEYLNMLRLYMNSHKLTKDFAGYLEEFPPTTSIKIQKALSYVDLLQDPDLGIAVLGQTSSKSIQELESILEENPHNWLARYARGLNNLYWPAGLNRAKSAIKDLSYCLAVVKSHEKKGDVLELWPQAYLAYGDALVKEGKIEEGIKVWKDGFSGYPDNKDLEKRARTNSDQAFAIVKEERGIEIFQRPNPNITDISILWKNK